MSITMGSTTDHYQYDLITLGAGSGGTRASRLAAALYKAKVAIVEVRGTLYCKAAGW